MILAREKVDYQSWEAPSQSSQKPSTRQNIKKQTTKSRRVYLVVVLMAFLLGILIASQYTRLAVAGYQLDKQQKQLVVLEKQNQVLNMQVSQLKSLNRIEQIATGKLGMVATQNVQFLAVARPSTQRQSVAVNQVAVTKGNSFQGIVRIINSIF